MAKRERKQSMKSRASGRKIRNFFFFADFQLGQIIYYGFETSAQGCDKSERRAVLLHVETILKQHYDWGRMDLAKDYMTVTDICKEAGIENPTTAEIKAAGALVRMMNGKKAKRTATGRFLLMPPKKSCHK